MSGLILNKLFIHGGRQLHGSVSVSGSKNAALPILSACLLSSAENHISNVPNLRDVETLMSLLKAMGVKISQTGASTYCISAKKLSSYTAPYNLVKKMRASILVLGPLLARFGSAIVSFPGGCAIGNRSVDMHLTGLQAMGAQIIIEHGYIKAESEGRLKGTEIYHDTVSVGATENLMMAAVLADGKTVINNAAREPEIIDLGKCLIKWGAKITGLGSSKIEIEGVEKLSGGTFKVMPDRIEAATYMAAIASVGGKVTLFNANINHLSAVIAKLKESGLSFFLEEDCIEIEMSNEQPKAVDIKTAPYPGFPTDMQAPFTVINALAKGTSVIEETIFENRLMHVPELRRMGANISVKDNIARIDGRAELFGAEVTASDLRASAALIIAGLAAKGETIISGLEHVERGYEDIQDKFKRLGAEIT